MSWVNGFYALLFGAQAKSKAKGESAAPDAAGKAEHAPPHSGSEADAGPVPHERPEPRAAVEQRLAPEETLYEHAPDSTISQGKQHHWLFDEGVLHWNQRRKETEFRPNFSGFNFVKQSQRSRLWGCPADLVGDERVILAGMDLRFADLQGCTLTRADLRRAHLQGANLRNANLAHVNFENADLTDCDLRNAVLDGADLSRARLVNANLSGASLKGTNLAWADITQMSACEKHLREANLFGAVRRVLAADGVFHS
jgi:uncharacterized protein YjbI with pentapeptide repeats